MVEASNRAACRGSPARVTVYVTLQWQQPNYGAWIDIVKAKTAIQVGEKRTVSVKTVCNGATLSGYRSRGQIYLNGVVKSSANSNPVVLPCGR